MLCMDVSKKLKELNTELELIQYWDREYYKRTNRDNVEVQAFQCRRVRQKQIIAEIIRLEEAPTDKQAEC